MTDHSSKGIKISKNLLQHECQGIMDYIFEDTIHHP